MIGGAAADAYFFTHPEFGTGELPGFALLYTSEGSLARLPLPAVPFGLDLSGDSVTDATPKDLDRFTTLHTLSLCQTKVTEAGLQRLARLTSLRALLLDESPANDAV